MPELEINITEKASQAYITGNILVIKLVQQGESIRSCITEVQTQEPGKPFEAKVVIGHTEVPKRYRSKEH